MEIVGTAELKVRKARVGQTLELEGRTHTVMDSCGGSSGRWICMEHPDAISPPTQLQKDIHINSDGIHTLAWVCPLHGLEIP